MLAASLAGEIQSCSSARPQFLGSDQGPDHSHRGSSTRQGSMDSMLVAEAAAGARAQVTLLELPAPWHEQLLEEVWPQERLHLFRSCRALRDLVLSRRTLTVEFQLRMRPDFMLRYTTPDDQDKLLLACQRATSVRLVCTPFWYQLGHHPTAEGVNASATDLLSSVIAALPAEDPGLPCIKSVKLRNLELNALVPPWLTTFCPNMTSLELHECSVPGLPPTTAAIPTCSQLKELKLSGVTAPGEQALVEEWRRQFMALTGLNSLHSLDSLCNPNSLFSKSQHLQFCSHLGTQLTQLTLDAFFVVQPLASQFPHLRDLCLLHCTVTDEDMETLLSLQHLTRFHCDGFSLQHTYTQRPCRWTHLGVRCLDIASFARLPLATVQVLSVHSSYQSITVAPSGDLDAANRVAAAIAARGGVTRPTGEDLSVTLQPKGGEADDTSLVASLLVVASCKPSSFRLWQVRPVTLEPLAAINQHLTSTRVIELYKCLAGPGVWSALLPSLPPAVQVLRLDGCVGFTEVELTEVCVPACRPVKVEVHSAMRAQVWQEGWEQRVQAAMAAAGHQHVTLASHVDSSDEEGSMGQFAWAGPEIQVDEED